MIATNTSPLIYLSKIGKLELLKILFKEIIIPRQVYEEVMNGKKEGYLDYLVFEKAVSDGWIKIKDIEIDKSLDIFLYEIDLGELALISLALKIKPDLVLIDDACARTIAESFNINSKGTLYVLLKALKKKIISKSETKNLLNQLVFSGFRISQEIYIKFLEEVEKY